MGFKSTVFVAKKLVSAAVATTPVPGTAGYLGPTMQDAAGYRYWSFAVTGITTATVTFYGTIDKPEWDSLAILEGMKNVYLVTDTNALWVPLGTATTNGMFLFSGPLLDAGAAVTTYTAGTITIELMAVE